MLFYEQTTPGHTIQEATNLLGPPISIDKFTLPDHRTIEARLWKSTTVDRPLNSADILILSLNGIILATLNLDLPDSHDRYQDLINALESKQ